jgi:uncharacterized repeat protein (TIGR03803 family)
MAEGLEARFMLSATTLNTIATFTGANGAGPQALVEDSSGNLFGVTTSDTTTGTGEVFEVPVGSNSINVLYHFPGGANGQTPTSLMIDSSGNLYGATSAGGADGDGIIFEIPKGQATPQIVVSSSQGGYLAGVGASGDIFMYNANGVYEVTHGTTTLTQISTTGTSSLTLASNGNLYGTQLSGQNADGTNNDGTVFEVTLTAATISTSTLATFDGSGGNGSEPQGVAIDSSGNVFGVTKYGGTDGSGTAFEIVNGSGVATTLVNFNADATSVGGQPACAPTIDSNGDLIGINIVGGANGFGSIWGIAPGTTTAVDLVDLTNTDIPGGTPGLGFATLQSAAPTLDAVHPAFENTVAAIYGYFGFGGTNPNDADSGGLGNLLTLPIPETLGGGGGGGSGGGGSGAGSSGVGVSAQSVSGSVPTSVVGDQTANSKVDVSVQNTSSAAVKGNVTVQLYVSSDGTLTNATPVGSPITKKVSLKASASKAIPIKIKSFPSEPAGSYQLVASVTDPSGNTSTAAGPSLTIAPAFVSTVISALNPVPASRKPSAKETLDFTLTNNGNTAATGTTSMAISLSTDPTGVSPMSLATVPVKVKLKAGHAGHYKVKFAVPSDLAPAAYYVDGTLDVATLGDPVASDGIGISVASFTVT